MTQKIVIAGATGRLGSRFAELVKNHEGYELLAGLDSSVSDLSIIKSADLLVDATVPEVSPKLVEYAAANGVNSLVATSGWTKEKIAELQSRISGNISVGITIIPNFSMGSVLSSWLAAKAAPFFEFVEIVESHHAKKIDSPSGTALHTAEQIAAARSGKSPVQVPGEGQPARGLVFSGIPVHSLRSDGVLARQEVRFGALGETVTITHQTVSAESYDSGFLAALPAAIAADGVTVGLDQLLAWDTLL